MIIGIGGVSRAGKSELARGLARHFRARGQSVQVLRQDDYVFPEEQIPRIRDRIDWEHPASINFARFSGDIADSARPHGVVIAEGLMAFYNEEVDRRYDFRLFLEIGPDTFWERKSRDLRWGPEPDWYIAHIWESYLQYGQPRDPAQVILINGEKELDWPRILAGLKKKAVKGRAAVSVFYWMTAGENQSAGALLHGRSLFGFSKNFKICCWADPLASGLPSSIEIGKPFKSEAY